MRTAILLAMIVVMMTCTIRKNNSGEDVTDTPPNIRLAHWLLGSWQSQSSDLTTYEIWEAVNDSTLSGRSYSIKNEDTVSSEVISLVQRDGQLTYIPTVSNQNQGMPIEFNATFIDRNKMIFENHAHDFPQIITYEHLSENSLEAEIFGVINGQQRAIKFPMLRIE